MTKKTLTTLAILSVAAALLPAALAATPEGPSARKLISLTDRPAETPYTPAILVKDTLYVSGQIAVDAATGKLVGTTMTEQAERVIENIGILCRKAGMDLSHVVETTAFVTDLAEFAEFNAVYRKFFPTAPPTRATVQVVKLAMGAKIEISAVAVR
jgi:2-iminobutanoate/2-iminopropanoate deaminase